MNQEMCIFILVLLVCLQIVNCHDEDAHTIQYNSDIFSSEVPKNNHFIMFYAPWCGHCQRLGPTWEQLAEMLNEDDSNIRIAKVDCTTDSKICSEQDITGYPTLKFFKRGSLESVKFRGTRDLPSLTTFINEQLRSIDETKNVPVEVPSTSDGLVELTAENFEKHVSQGKHFVKFYAPWCGFCQRLAPTWEQLASKWKFDGGVTVAKVDCSQYRTFCDQYEIKGYPTLLWIENGEKIDRYQGQRTLESLEEYINKMLGTTTEKIPEFKNESNEEVESPVIILNKDNFKKDIEKGITLVKFFAPWCGHCKRLAPTWEELAKRFSDSKQARIAKVDCTVDANKPLCSEEEVDGFPTIFMYKNGAKVTEYDGDRSLDDLQEFVNKHLDKHDEL
ncbi:thioredoxin domain-containing protein 5 homolog [Agrilus planipennis]|uniref:Thioredoxin domain-containing protein 5 homolog n=1 Tax=Agrilus planipennis TaxID=224129 RepID=A0A1W4WW63_AGRPL|nr:thioredoxin domain-containing protein 5 homolog [Agrilus planipennis]